VIVAVPIVEVTDNIDAASLWRPDGEGDAFSATDSGDVRAELFVDLFVPAFAEEMEVDVAECNHGLHGF
jgi:hypothetical protein